MKISKMTSDEVLSEELNYGESIIPLKPRPIQTLLSIPAEFENQNEFRINHLKKRMRTDGQSELQAWLLGTNSPKTELEALIRKRSSRAELQNLFRKNPSLADSSNLFVAEPPSKLKLLPATE